MVDFGNLCYIKIAVKKESRDYNMNEFADMVSKEVKCSLANDFWSKISCGDYVELYLVIIIILLFTLIFTIFVKLLSDKNN